MVLERELELIFLIWYGWFVLAPMALISVIPGSCIYGMGNYIKTHREKKRASAWLSVPHQACRENYYNRRKDLSLYVICTSSYVICTSSYVICTSSVHHLYVTIRHQYIIPKPISAPPFVYHMYVIFTSYARHITPNFLSSLCTSYVRHTTLISCLPI